LGFGRDMPRKFGLRAGWRDTLWMIIPCREAPACLSRPDGVDGELHIAPWTSRGIKERGMKVNGTATTSLQVLVQSLSLCYVSYRAYIEDQESFICPCLNYFSRMFLFIIGEEERS
jgi:hypothetical protein